MYISQTRQKALADWIDQKAATFTRIPPAIQGVMGPEDAYGVAKLAMLQAVQRGHTDEALLFVAARNAVTDEIRLHMATAAEPTSHKIDSSGGGLVELERFAELPDPRDRITEALSRHITDDVLALVDTRTAQVLRWLLIEGRLQRDVAAELGVSREVVTRIKARGLAKLKAALAQGK